ncbi:MAG TPA: hypothetical protein VGQ08_13305 [Nitrospiraceae bacterium]|jgi:hypothetical protein|nr:hypothetical protein [Nitrospiraceae bacterium]
MRCAKAIPHPGTICTKAPFESQAEQTVLGDLPYATDCIKEDARSSQED